MPVLATVASSAPFVGLFGTVVGIITAFQKLADPTKGGGGIGTVSAGIAEALVPPPSASASPSSRSGSTTTSPRALDDITIDIDETASELVDTILREARVNGACHAAGRRRAAAAGKGRRLRSGDQRHPAGRRRARAADHLHGHHADDRPRRQRRPAGHRATTTRRTTTTRTSIVSINASGDVYLDADKVASDKLTAAVQEERRRHPDKGVFLKADHRIRYGVARAAMEAIHRAGVEDVQIGTDETEAGGETGARGPLMAFSVGGGRRGRRARSTSPRSSTSCSCCSSSSW